MQLSASLVLVLLFQSVTAQEDPPFVVHEWGTFTTLQRSNGQRLSGLYVDEEKLPTFVRNIAFQYWETTLDWKGYYIGTTLRNVNVKMETPVIYFYSDEAVQVHVDIEFDGGSISQWYPARTDGEVDPETSLIDFAGERKGWISWDATVLHPEDKSPITSDPTLETPQWVRPRATKSNKLRGIDGSVEKFLFYRGIGNFDVPVKVEFNVNHDLVITNQGVDGISFVMVYEKRKNEIATVAWSGELAGNYSKVVQRDLHGGTEAEVQQDLKEFENALVNAGLYRDEAKAMLETWKESYFEREGLKVFWICPSSFTDQILPLNITPKPDELERVIVGRSEVLTPEFEAAIMFASSDGLYAQWKNDRFYYAYAEVWNQGSVTEWTSITSDGFNGIANDDGPIPYVAIPNPFQNEISIYGEIKGADEIFVSAYNTIGERVLSLNILLYDGSFSDKLDLSHLVPGLYFIEVSDGQNSWTRKIVKGR